MRIFDVADGRQCVQFDRGRNGPTFVWCAGPLGYLEGSALGSLPEAQCAATVLVPAGFDGVVAAALRGQGWVGGDGGREWRCPVHA